jgi:transcriptional activator SPT7
MSSSGNHFHPSPLYPHNGSNNILSVNGAFGVPSRSRTPVIHSEHSYASQLGNPSESEPSVEEDPRTKLFNGLFAASEARLEALFGKGDGEVKADAIGAGPDGAQEGHAATGDIPEPQVAQPKRPVRKIDEDDYNDSDDEEETPNSVSPLKAKSTGPSTVPRLPSPAKKPGIPPSPALTATQGSSSQTPAKTTEEIRKRLEEDRRAAEEAVKQSFHTRFFSLDNDRDAMLERQKLQDADQQVESEIQGNAANTHGTEGTLSQANLGASSLVLKHLIARIDAKREKVKASDQELRNLMIEVKKNRSKWANEDKVGQEELYEAAEKVLSEIKAVTVHSQPFLQKVNKRDAPDYYNGKQ